MTHAEFSALPPGLQVKVLCRVLGRLHGQAFSDALVIIEAPKVPRAPKFDQRISRKGGYQWASETDLEGLKYWQHRLESNANEGGQYAEKNAKQADKLSYWVAWREAYPEAIWTGQRNDDVCTAAAPSGKPRVHEWEPRGEKPLRDRSDADDTGGGDDSFPEGWG